jgi:hypothetical protein
MNKRRKMEMEMERTADEEEEEEDPLKINTHTNILSNHLCHAHMHIFIIDKFDVKMFTHFPNVLYHILVNYL